jgi:hypothetical protein
MEGLKPAIEKAGFTAGEPSVKLPAVLSLKSYLGKYLSAQPDGRLEWNRDWERDWELFKVEAINGNKVAFKSCHGLYLSVKDNGTVMCDQREAGENEAWTAEWAGSGIAFKSSSGKYLRPKKDGNVAVKYYVAEEKEIFTLTDHSTVKPQVELPGIVSLKSYQDKYLSAQPDGRLEWNQDWNRDQELFKTEVINGNKVAFKSCHGLYLSVKDDGTVMCDQQEPGKNEAWTAEWAGSGIALKSRFGKYLRPEKDGSVTATSDKAAGEAAFMVTDHSQGGK